MSQEAFYVLATMLARDALGKKTILKHTMPCLLLCPLAIGTRIGSEPPCDYGSSCLCAQA